MLDPSAQPELPAAPQPDEPESALGAAAATSGPAPVTFDPVGPALPHTGPAVEPGVSSPPPPAASSEPLGGKAFVESLPLPEAPLSEGQPVGLPQGEPLSPGPEAEAGPPAQPNPPLANGKSGSERTDGERTQPSSADTGQPPGFRNPSLLTALELRQAGLKHEQFTRTLSTRLSIYLRTELLARVAALQVLSHPKLVAGLPERAHFALFRLEPIYGLGLLATPWRLSLALADRLLGGPGQADTCERGPTEVERAVLDLLSSHLLKEWAQTVLGVEEPRPQIVGHETYRHFLPLGPADGQFLHLVMEMQLGSVTEPVHLGFTFGPLEPLLRQPQPVAQPSQQPPSPASPEALEWHPGFEEIPVRVTAAWDGLRLTAEQLANLKVGDWLPLDPVRFEQVQVRLERQPKFVGRLGVAHRSRAVELIGPIESKQALVS